MYTKDYRNVDVPKLVQETTHTRIDAHLRTTETLLSLIARHEREDLLGIAANRLALCASLVIEKEDANALIALSHHVAEEAGKGRIQRAAERLSEAVFMARYDWLDRGTTDVLQGDLKLVMVKEVQQRAESAEAGDMLFCAREVCRSHYGAAEQMGTAYADLETNVAYGDHKAVKARTDLLDAKTQVYLVSVLFEKALKELAL